MWQTTDRWTLMTHSVLVEGQSVTDKFLEVCKAEV